MITFTIPKATIIKVNGIDAVTLDDVTLATGFGSQQELSEHLSVAGLLADCKGSITESVKLGAGRTLGEVPVTGLAYELSDEVRYQGHVRAGERYDEPLTDSTGEFTVVSFADLPDEEPKPTKKKTKKGK